jgi:Bifunctional DNA primase/polymerase, N-terminal
MDDSVSGYLARGWSVVALHGVTPGGLCTCEPRIDGEPCPNRGKHPLYANWQKIPIRELGVWQAIAGWRAERGIATNVGLATGKPSGVFALDVDPKNGGIQTLQEYEAKGWRLPPTWEQKTGGQGLHCLFTMPGDFEPTNATGNLGPGLDIRGTGGQIVLAPSVTDKGSYEVLRDTEPWAAPFWILDAIRPAPYTPREQTTHNPRTVDARAAAYAARAQSAVLDDLRHEASSRNSTAYRVACRLHELINAGWLDPDATLDAYLEASEQASANKPEPFGQHEAVHVWENAESRTAGNAAELPPSTMGGTALDFPQPLTGASGSSGLSTTDQSAPSSPGFFAAPGQSSFSGISQEVSATGPSLNLPPEFWAARPVLKHIQMAAHSRLVSADVMLHSLLTRLSALWPHQVRLDTGILSPASANLFTAVVGPTGAGKSAGVGLAKRLLGRPHWLAQDDYADDRPLGSGEGMSEVYMGQKTVSKLDEHGTPIQDTKGAVKTEKVRAQVRHNALLHADEGEVLAKVMERQGATLGVELRRAWSGGTIGQSNGRSETTRVVEGGRYSMGLVIGFQLNTVQRLLTADETTSGTTQRFLFCWALDPSIPRERLPDPGPLSDVWPAPAAEGADPSLVWLMPPGKGGSEVDLRPVTFDQGILDRLWEERWRRGTTMPEADEELGSQGPVTVVKLSALLAYLDGHRRHVTEEDWRLATMVWEASCRVRDYAIETGRRAAGKALAADRERHATREAQASVAKLDAVELRELERVERVAQTIARYVQARDEPSTRRQVQSCVSSRDKGVSAPGRVTAALTLCVERLWVALEGEAYVPGAVKIG